VVLPLATVDAPPPRFACLRNVFQEKLIIFGGENATEIFTDVWAFGIPTLTWRELQCADLPSPRS
jgi:hypothetical protein